MFFLLISSFSSFFSRLLLVSFRIFFNFKCSLLSQGHGLVLCRIVCPLISRFLYNQFYNFVFLIFLLCDFLKPAFDVFHGFYIIFILVLLFIISFYLCILFPPTLNSELCNFLILWRAICLDCFLEAYFILHLISFIHYFVPPITRTSSNYFSIFTYI